MSWPARVSLSQTKVVQCKAFDISLGGIGIESDEGFPVQAILSIAVQVPISLGAAERRIVGGKARAVFQVLSAGRFRTGFEWVSPGEALLAALAWTQEV